MEKKISQYIFVILELVKKELKRQHSESHLGALWNVANPLLFMIVMSALYGTIFKHDIENFQIYFMIGILIFNFYKFATTSAMGALVTNKVFLIRTKLPKNIFILEKVCFAFINFLYSLVALLFLLIYYNIRPTRMIIFIIPDLILTIFIVIGIGKILSIIYVYFADISYLYSIFMTLVMFGSALFYPSERFTGVMRQILEINPVFISVTIARDSVLYGVVPQTRCWLGLLLWAIFTYGIGSVYYKRKSSNIIQYL